MRVLHAVYVIVTLILYCAEVAQAQALDTAFCGESDDEYDSQPSFVADGDTVRALVVLVKYRDDDFTPTWDVLDWPLTPDPTELPAFADGLIDSTYNPTTFRDSTISSYFYEQSRPQGGAPGKHVLYGDVVPYVHVSELDEADYSDDRAELTQEVLDSLYVQQGC